jgi:hypothetical protein
MSSSDLPLGDRKIAEMLDSEESEAGAKLREVIHSEIEPEQFATREYMTAMSIALA